jgi:predicted MFS family arabinose efflux permease
VTTEETESPGRASRLFGGTIDVGLRPVLGVTFLQAITESAQTSFLGLWALRSLGSSQSQLGGAFACAAVAALLAGYVAGHLSDHIGRRRPILVASAALPIVGTCLGFAGNHVLVGLALMVCLGATGGALFAAQQALLTDIAPSDRHDHAFASQRVVQNIAFTAGPLLGAAFLTVGWRTLFIGTSAIAALAFLVALNGIPQRAPVASDHHGPQGSIRVLLRDPSLALLLAAGLLATMVYLSYETLLPISLVQSHGVSPAAWGILLAVNPVVVVLCQFRVSSRVGGWSEYTRLTLGIAAMATPFLLVAVSTALPLLILMLLLFVVGEMLWAPPSQSLVARLAPDDMKGAYFGASGAVWPAALAVGPLVGLQVREKLGDSAMWAAIAIIGALAIVLYGAAGRVAGRSVRRS